MPNDNEGQEASEAQKKPEDQNKPGTEKKPEDRKKSEEQKKLVGQKRNVLLILIALGILVSGFLISTGSGIRLGHLPVELDLMRLVIGVIILIVTFVLAVMAYWCDQACTTYRYDTHAVTGLDQIESLTLRHILLGAGVLVIGTFGWAGTFLLWKEQPELALPIVIIAGVIILLLVLGLLTFAFSVLKLTDSKEALGLPSGSVRAVIALMLLVIFAIVAIFLYSDVSSNSKLQTLTVPSDQVAEIKKHIDYVAEVDEVKNEKKTGNKTVYYRSGSRAAEDLAKQLIVLLGTLVTAVSSFYFGSASVAAVTKPPGATGGPNAKAVKNGNLNAGGDPQPLTITGTNLGNVVGVKLTFDKEEPILGDASTVVASDTNVTCKIKTSPNSKYGPWTVVVSDNANNDSRVPDGVTIGTKPEPAVAPPEPKLIDQTKLKPNATHTIKISGSNLASVEKVRFDPDTGVTVSIVKPVTPGEVTCTVTIAAASGERQVFVANKDGKEVAVPTKVTIEG